MTAWEDFLLDLLRVVVIVWLIGAVVFGLVFTPRALRSPRGRR